MLKLKLTFPLVWEESLKMDPLILAFLMFLWVFQQEYLIKPLDWRGFSIAKVVHLKLDCDLNLIWNEMLDGPRFI